jgi:hypothetical protein
MAFIYFVFDGFYSAILAFMATVSFVNLAGATALAWTGLPPQVCWCIGQCGLPAGLAVISSAMTIRLLLNLIPSWLSRI